MQEMRVRFLGQENPPEEAMATHSNILAWVILWQRRLVGLVLCGMWDLPEPGMKLVSLALQSGFLTTGPPGKPSAIS